MSVDKDIVDGFTLSASQLYTLPSYRAHALASMEVLRRAASYRCRQYVCPVQGQETIPAFTQVEMQVACTNGSYLWGLSFIAPEELNDDEDYSSFITIKVTDACTEATLYADYAKATQVIATQAVTGTNSVVRNPFILAQPRLIGTPGLINVEIYNAAVDDDNQGVDVTCQLLLLMAEPALTPDQIASFFEAQRIGRMIS